MFELLPQIKIPATYMRGGTSKGVFFNISELPADAQQAGQARDALLLRVMGSPDPYGKQTDGMGGATSSTSKAVLVERSQREGHDVNYLFGQVAIDRAFIDWSGNCGNLTAAVGAFAIHQGLVDASRVPVNGLADVRIWQANISKTIVVRVPIADGQVQETGDFELDGVTFPAAEIKVMFMEPGASTGGVLPTGNLIDELIVPGESPLQATMINAGIPTVFLLADQLGYMGTELQSDINSDAMALKRFEKIRTHGAVAMGLAESIEEASNRQHTPKIAFVAPPKPYTASSGKEVMEGHTDLLVRALSMGLLHHAMMGTAAVAIATAAAIPGTLVDQVVGHNDRDTIVFGHPSGTMTVGASVSNHAGAWRAESASMSRSARVLMEGWVRVPENNT